MNIVADFLSLIQPYWTQCFTKA